MWNDKEIRETRAAIYDALAVAHPEKPYADKAREIREGVAPGRRSW